MLGAAERGLGGCMFGSGNPDRIREALGLPGHITPSLVLALGKPDETVVLEDIPADGKHLYYRDEHNVHHVPKRTMAEILL
jgi:nitroreductase